MGRGCERCPRWWNAFDVPSPLERATVWAPATHSNDVTMTPTVLPHTPTHALFICLFAGVAALQHARSERTTIASGNTQKSNAGVGVAGWRPGVRSFALREVSPRECSSETLTAEEDAHCGSAPSPCMAWMDFAFCAVNNGGHVQSGMPCGLRVLCVRAPNRTTPRG